MNNEEEAVAYRALMLRFAKEIDDVGVTENMRKLIEGLCQSAPNRAYVSAEETTDRFVYRHDGYMIEAKRTVSVIVKKCK